MDVDAFKTLLESGDLPKRHAAARDLGRNFAAHRSGDWILKTRRIASRLQKVASTDYERGFFEALELVATGFDRQVTDARVDESEIVRIRTRAHWLPALRTLEAGAQRPSDLAERLGISKSHATKLIDDLEEAELVTRAVEGKERPCSLTPRAHLLLEKLPEEKLPTLEEVVPAIVDCMGSMSREHRVGRSRFLTRIQHVLGAKAAPRVLEVFARSLQEHRLGFLDEDDALVATEMALQTRLAHYLSLACAGKPSPLVDRLSRMEQASDVILRVPSGSFEWDVITTKLLNRVQVVTDADLESDAPRRYEQRYQLVYGSPALLFDDLRQGREDLANKAFGRYYFDVDTTPSIKNFLPIEISTPDADLRGGFARVG